MKGIKSTEPTLTDLVQRFGSECKHCGKEVKTSHEWEVALDRQNVIVGTVHAGFCAHQFRNYIPGSGGG